MKTIVLFIAMGLLINSVYAQETTKIDDALLLDYYQTQRFADAADYLKKLIRSP